MKFKLMTMALMLANSSQVLGQEQLEPISNIGVKHIFSDKTEAYNALASAGGFSLNKHDLMWNKRYLSAKLISESMKVLPGKSSQTREEVKFTKNWGSDDSAVAEVRLAGKSSLNPTGMYKAFQTPEILFITPKKMLSASTIAEVRLADKSAFNPMGMYTPSPAIEEVRLAQNWMSDNSSVAEVRLAGKSAFNPMGMYASSRKSELLSLAQKRMRDTSAIAEVRLADEHSIDPSFSIKNLMNIAEVRLADQFKANSVYSNNAPGFNFGSSWMNTNQID